MENGCQCFNEDLKASVRYPQSKLRGGNLVQPIFGGFGKSLHQWKANDLLMKDFSWFLQFSSSLDFLFDGTDLETCVLNKGSFLDYSIIS